MKRKLLVWCSLALFVGCTPPQPGTPPIARDPVVSGRVGIPGSFTNGIPFTTSTPFTNSTPAPMGVSYTTQAVTLPATQSLQVIDPLSGQVIQQAQINAEGRFSVAVPPSLKTAILQVIVRDTKGQIYGLIAMATQPAEPDERVISPGSTIVPLAGALSLQENRTMTYGTGFAGVPRPQLARVLEGLSETTSKKASATFDERIGTGGTNATVMSTVTRTAQSLASYATQGTAATPEVIGDRLSIALEHNAQPSTPPPSPTPPPTPTPSPSPSHWVGRGPAIPRTMPTEW